MIGAIIGKRYAKALINLAESSNSIEKVGNEVAEIANFFEEESLFKNSMKEPKLSKEKKVEIVDAITKQMECDALVNKFCRYLTSKNRFSLIGDISTAFNSIASAKLGKATAKVVVSDMLSTEEEQALQKNLVAYTGKDISLSIEVDKSIIGGAITSIESLVLDGSIKNRLNLIKETLSKGN